MGFLSKFVSLFQNSHTKKNIENIEDILLETGLSPTLTYTIIDTLNKKLFSVHSQEKIISTIRESLEPMLKEYTLKISSLDNPTVILMVGINGVGKTTSIAKLAYRCMQYHKIPKEKLLFCAADTFRAGAIEQLSTHANNLDIDIIKQQQRSDSSAVIYDSITHALATKKQIVFIDTAGRMHTRNDLMQQVEKNYRVILKQVKEEQIKILITLDGNSGQNTITQAEEFMTHLPLNATIVTKHDGSNKGGIIPSITQKLTLPCAFLGIGEKYQDLIEFNTEDFLNEFLSF